MESPVVVDKPPEYHGSNDRGFPFEEEEGSGAWSELAARHPDIAARLRQRPATATWARKRRPSSQDATDDFGESFSGFDRFPFDDIPPEFRDHFPSHWNRRFSGRDEPPADGAHAQTQAQQAPPAPTQPQQHTAATQTENEPETREQEQNLPQYGLRNTVDLGQKSPCDPSVDADDRTQRSMSAPPDARTLNPDMSAHEHEPAHAPHHEQPSNVRHIPIFVEGRDEPVINKNVDHGTHFGDTKPAYQPPPQPHVDRDQYFTDDGPPSFHHPANFTRAFGTPFNKGFRQGPQPFTQQKAYPQSAFARAASPQRAQSPKPPPQEEPHVRVPVHHEPPRTRKPSPGPQPRPEPQREQTPPPRPQPSPNDPITQILSIQTDVLNLMTEVENFKGTKKDKRYIFLDEMLTRNLIKLDNIETEGKENIRQARKEAIRCIQKCIAVLEAKAESNDAGAKARQLAQSKDIEMKESSESVGEPELVTENGEVDMKEAAGEEASNPGAPQQQQADEVQPPKQGVKEDVQRETTPKLAEEQTQEQNTTLENAQTQLPEADTRTEEAKPEEKVDEQKKEVENKPSPKKKVVKKRDKSNDKNEAAKDSNAGEASKDSSKPEVAEAGEKVEVMQVDDKGDKLMEVDGAASQ